MTRARAGVATAARAHNEARSAGGGVGVGIVLFFALASVGVLLVVDGVVPTAFAATGLTAVPDAFAVVGAVLALFVPGYVAMTRYISSGGAMYAMTTAGLGRPAGAAVYYVGITAYGLLGVALYGIFGVEASGFAAVHFGMSTNTPWWAWALAAWALTTVAGQVKVREVGVALALLTCCELVITMVIAITGLVHAHAARAGGFFHALSPSGMSWASLGPALAIAALGFIGFETTAVYRREARNPRRTVTLATFTCLLGSAAVYLVSSWSLDAFYGSQTVAVAQEQGPAMFPAMGTSTEALVANSLLLTSLLAALIGYSQTWARLVFTGARSGLMPLALSRTGPNQVPRAAALAQSACGVAAIAVTTWLGWDPLTQLFYIGGTAGGWAVLCMMCVTSAAVLRFFTRHSLGESVWVARIFPLLSAVLIAASAVLATIHFRILIGVTPADGAAYVFPLLFAAIAVLGATWALYLRAKEPGRYEALKITLVEMRPEPSRRTAEIAEAV